MTTILQVVPDPRAAPAPPNLHPGVELLTVTVHPIHPGEVVITVCGEVDLCTGPLLRDSLLAQVREAGPHLIVDLTGVGFFGAAGLTVLAVVRQAALAVGTGLCLVAHARAVLLPLTITGMDTLFDIHPSLAHALTPGGLRAERIAP